MYWWNKRPNFGDTLGPLLVQRITGRPVVHRTGGDDLAPLLLTVGSLLGNPVTRGSQVWGSGLIASIPGEKVDVFRHRRMPAAVHAVRGRLSRQELVSKAGWDIPEVFGDPALLAPWYLHPPVKGPSSGRAVLVPHGVHRKHFLQPGVDEDFHVVDTRHDPEQVVHQIAHASRCVSTSLHGVIIAHAYGVPWTWLRLSDKPLMGGDFKFEDFFTLLDRDRVSRADIAADDIDPPFLRRSASGATRPRDSFDAQALLDAFPALP